MGCFIVLERGIRRYFQSLRFGVRFLCTLAQHDKNNEWHEPLVIFMCKDSFVNTMNTKMSITVRNGGRLVFTFRNGSEETVMM